MSGTLSTIRARDQDVWRPAVAAAADTYDHVRMPQSIWKGAISFGLVSIPVRLFSATEEKDISFRQVHREDGGRIRYKRVCSVDGEEVAYADIAKGYELPDGEMIVLDDDDFANLPISSSRSVEVLSFVPAEQIDAVQMGKPYYCDPTGGDVKPYVLLRDSLEKADRVAVVKVALRQRERLAMLRAARGRARAADPALARRGARAQARVRRHGRHGAPAGAGDGRVLHQRAVRRLRAGRVLRRLPAGARGGHRGQGCRPRGQGAGGGAAARPGRWST